MNIKFTKKDILSNFANIICVGYCDIQYLLRYIDRIGYTCGVYGWNADIYKIDNATVIVTGYRPFGNISTKYDKSKYYNKLKERRKRIKWKKLKF